MSISIRAKLILAFFLALLLVIGFGMYSLYISRIAVRQAVGRGSVFLAEDTMGRIDKDIFLRIEEIQLYSKDAPLQGALVESNEAFAPMKDRQDYIINQDKEWREQGAGAPTAFMAGIIENDFSNSLRSEFIDFWENKYGYRLYGEVFVTNKYGVNIAQTGRTTDYYQADEEWWQEAQKNGFSVSEIEYDESAKTWTMPIGVRIEDARGDFLGVVKAIPVAGEMVRETEITTKKYETTEVRLVTKDGRLIYSSQAFQIFKDVSQEEFFKNIKSLDAYGEPFGSGFFVGKGGGEREKLFAYTHSKGFRNFGGLGWILVIAHDAAEVFAEVETLQKALVIISSLIFIAFGLIALFLIRSILIPIRKLTQGANYIARGNLGVKINIKTRDEIGQLAASFNEMTSKLRKSYQNLEGKVRMRTFELEERFAENDKIAKALVRRDLELSEVRRKQEDQLVELDKAAKALVRRDLELLRLNDELQEVDRAKSHFVSVAAHQMRTPLSIIKWTFRMLLTGDFGALNKEQKEVVQRGYDVNEGTIKLISDLLDVARIESGKFFYTFTDVLIEEIIHETIDMNALRAKERRISLQGERESRGKIPAVRGDKETLKIVIQNLVTNALNYTLPGGKVDILYKKEKDFVWVRVKDTGVGIPRHQMSRLFTKFFRGDNVVRMQTSGTGLGLFIAKSIIQDHGGEIGAESEEGRGSTFWFKIPIVAKN